MEKLPGVGSCISGKLDFVVMVKEREKLKKENVAIKAKVQLLSLKITEQTKHVGNLNKELEAWKKEINTLGSNIRNHTYGHRYNGSHGEEKIIMAKELLLKSEENISLTRELNKLKNNRGTLPVKHELETNSTVQKWPNFQQTGDVSLDNSQLIQDNNVKVATEELSKSQMMTRSKQSQLLTKTTPQWVMNSAKKKKVTTKNIQSKEKYLNGMNMKPQISTKVKKCQGKTKIKLRKSLVHDKITLADRREKNQGDKRMEHNEEVDEWGEVCMVDKSVGNGSEEMGTPHNGTIVVLRKPKKLMTGTPSTVVDHDCSITEDQD